MAENLNFEAGKFVRFSVVGISAALLYFVSVSLLGIITTWPLFWRVLPAYLLTFSAAYLLQRNWTFRSSAPYVKSFTRYACAQAACMIVTALLSEFALNVLDLGLIPSALVSTVIAGAMSFILSAAWAFSEQ